MEPARRHVLFALRGELAEDLQALRVEWDPVMAARVPPHVTLVYPEETVNESLLLDRVAQVADATAPFAIWLGDLESSDRGGVWFPVVDPSDSWERLRSRLLAPPSHRLPVTPHATVVHPRTSDRGREAMSALTGTRFDGPFDFDEILFTETSREGTAILHRFSLAEPPPVRVVAGLLRSDGRVLLCHRHPQRENYPDVWDLPGGHLEAGEAIAETLVRELAEELGITVEPPAGPPWMILSADGLELNLFVVDQWAEKPHNASPDEHDDIRWVAIDDLPHLDLAHPSYVEMLKRALAWQPPAHRPSIGHDHP